jgi:hypothetical protein
MAFHHQYFQKRRMAGTLQNVARLRRKAVENTSRRSVSTSNTTARRQFNDLFLLNYIDLIRIGNTPSTALLAPHSLRFSATFR